MRFDVSTDERLTTIDVTDRVRTAVREKCGDRGGDGDADGAENSTEDGVCTVFTHHTTAALVVQENEQRLRGDLESFLSGLVPDEGHAHDELDGNADSHLRATLLGPSVTVPVDGGELALGRWQSILLVECDGPRTRQVSVSVTIS